jgi:hypothetical protein
MNSRRLMSYGFLMLALAAGLSGCQSTFQRACLKAENCERTPVNGRLVLEAERSTR